MNLAFVLSRVPVRTDLPLGPIDNVRLGMLAKHHELVVMVDEETSACDLLRDEGIRIECSTKRSVTLGRGTVSADAIRAKQLARHHQNRRLDAILYGSDQTVDLAWLDKSLAGIPRASILGQGLVRDIQFLWSDPALLSDLLPDLQLGAGLIATADYLLSDIDPSEFGLRTESLPPVLCLDEPLEVLPPPSNPVDGWLCVVATTASRVALATLVHRVSESVCITPRTTLFVLVSDLPFASELPMDLVLGGCPDRLRLQTVVVPLEDGTRVGDILERSDRIVCQSSSELGIIEVRAAVRQRGCVLLEPPKTSTRLTTLTTEALPASSRKPCRIVGVDSPLPDLVDLIDLVAEDLVGGGHIVLHAPEAEVDALTCLEVGIPCSADLVLFGRHRGTFGDPEPRALSPYSLGFSVSSWPSIRRWMCTCESLLQLIQYSSSNHHLASCRTLILPSRQRQEEFMDEVMLAATPVWLNDSGILPTGTPILQKKAPVIQFVESNDNRARENPPSEPAPVEESEPALVEENESALVEEAVLEPTNNGGPPPMSTAAGVHQFAKERRWFDRLRLGLPWRLGLLSRAMRRLW